MADIRDSFEVDKGISLGNEDLGIFFGTDDPTSVNIGSLTQVPIGSIYIQLGSPPDIWQRFGNGVFDYVSLLGTGIALDVKDDDDSTIFPATLLEFGSGIDLTSLGGGAFRIDVGDIGAAIDCDDPFELDINDDIQPNLGCIFVLDENEDLMPSLTGELDDFFEIDVNNEITPKLI